MSDFVHVSVGIARASADVYDYVVDPLHLPLWAAGLSSSVELVDGEWVADSPLGAITLRFAERNPFGVLDHWVTFPTGEIAYNPLRVFDDDGSCQVLFSVHRGPGATDDEFGADVAAVRADLDTLKLLLESDD